MNECPKCGRAMIAIFSIPKCELCELAPDPKTKSVETFGITMLRGDIDSHRDSGAVFMKFEHAISWRKQLETRGSGFVLVRAGRMPNDPIEIAWEDATAEAVQGGRYARCRVYSTEAKALAAPRSHVPTFYVIEDLG